MNARCYVVVFAVLSLAACAAEPPAPAPEVVEVSPQWSVVAPQVMSEAQRAQMDKGLEVQKAVAEHLMAALKAAMDEGGPEAAIEVCHERATDIAVEQASGTGVFVGRTSQRLRNPANLAPDWAQETVAAGVAEAVFLAGPEGQLGGLVPILMRPECEMCHGNPESIDEELAARLAEFYPEDQAIGFVAGDLRGWFWFKVPPQ